MERILFDYSFYQNGSKYHGGGEYGNVILDELLKTAKGNNGLFYRGDRRIDEKMLEKAEKAGWDKHPIRDARNIPALIKKYGYTTIYSPLPYGVDWKPCRSNNEVRFIGTFHGFRGLELGEYWINNNEEDNLPSPSVYDFELEKKRYADSLFSFDNTEIVVVSSHSKYSLLYYFPEAANRNIRVFYSPEKLNDFKIFSDTEKMILEKYGLKSGCFGMMVSSDWWYKNIRRGIRAYDLVFSGNYNFVDPDYKVVVLGDSGNKEIMLKNIKNPSRFIFLDYVKSEELEVLYKNAHLFLYPSLNEGFGYPPIEAMKYGTLCACSANTAISEICRDAVWYFNPLDVNEMAIRILTCFSDEERAEKQDRIKEVIPALRSRQKKDLQSLVDLIINR